MTQTGSRWQAETVVGRRAERDLIAKLAAAARGGTFRVLIVEGEAGVGKSTLLGSVSSALAAFQIVNVRCDRNREHDTGAAIEQVENALGLTGFGARRGYERGLGLAAGLVARQRQQPVALIMDDLQWCDAETRVVIGVALRKLPKHARVLVLAASRPCADRTSACAALVKADASRCHVVRLAGLPPQHVAELVRSKGVRLHPRHVGALHLHTRGNPGHVLALLDEAREQVCTGKLRLAAPRQLVRQTTQALDRLPSDTRAVAEALSVLDRRSPIGVVAEVSGVEHVADAVEPAVAAGLVTREHCTIAEQLEIAHPLTAAAIYRTMPRGARRLMHSRAAELCSGHARIEHRASAAEAADDALAAELAELARKCGQARSHGLAAEYLSWSARLSIDADSRDARFLDSCYQHLLDRNQPAVLVELDRVRSLPDSPRRDLVLGVLAHYQGRISDAVDLLAEAQAAVDADREPELFAQLTCELGWALHLIGAPGDVVVRTVAPLLEHAGSDQAVQDAAACLMTLAHGADLGVTAIATGQGLQAESSPVLTEMLILRASLTWWGLGERRRSLRDLDEVMARFERGESSRLIGAAYDLGAAVNWFAGNWTRTETFAELARQVSSIEEQALSYSCSSLVPSCQGNWPTARAHLEHALEAIRRVPHPDVAVQWSFSLITYCHAADDPVTLRRHIDGDLMRQALTRVGQDGWQGWLLFEFVRGLLLAGQVSRARNIAEGLAPDPQWEPWTAMAGSWVRGLVAERSGDPAGARAWFEEGLQLAERHGSTAPLYHAHLLADAGRLLCAQGTTRRGEELVRVAHAIYEQLGARPFADRVKRLLLPADASAGETGLSLTDKERAIVLLVAEGLTNKEIGRRLLVTDKTVEFHLSNVYAKCRVRGRRQLRELAGSLFDGGGADMHRARGA